MSIIEKFGITPGPWEWHKHNGLDSSALFFGNDDDRINYNGSRSRYVRICDGKAY